MSIDDIITSDKFLELSTNFISRKKTFIDINEKNNIFFIKTDYLDFFSANILPKINFSFVLITHESDFAIPGNHHPILENPYLLKWFGMNCHSIHPKLQPLPIGMANEEWSHGSKATIVEVSNVNYDKTELIYCNYDISTNTSERAAALDTLNTKSFITKDFNKSNFKTYLETVAKYKFIISPPGNSVDCHRIWESIYLGTIPVCLKSIPLVYFKDCPILFVDNWEQVTEEFLQKSYQQIKMRSKQKALFKHYADLILSTLSS
jgi:hypothetical protein